MKIYTKTGDSGQTSLFGGERVLKSDLRIETYGTVDELNAFLGMAAAEIADKELKEVIESIQNELFAAGAELATPVEKQNKVKVHKISEETIDRIEKLIDKYDAKLPELKRFILPGGSKTSAILHIARTVCRRAERRVVELSSTVEISGNIRIYLNRLSDFLFVLSRYENQINQIPDVEWKI